MVATDATANGALEGWKRELQHKILISSDSIQDYLRKYVPSNAPDLPTHNISKLFNRWKPKAGREVESYPGLVRFSLIYRYAYSLKWF